MRLPGWLSERAQSVVIDDLWTDGRFEGSGTLRSLLARPLYDPGGRLLAVLVLTHSDPGMFGPEDITTLARLTSAAETALGHASAYERAGWASDRLARQLAAIQRTARELNAKLEPEAIAGRTLDCAIEIAGARAGAVLVEVDGLHPLVRSTNGGLSAPARQMLVQTAQGQRPDLENDVSAGVLIPGAGSRLLVPIRHGSRAFGALVIEIDRTRAFNGQDMQAVASLASHAAVALENARLFRQIQAEREKSQQIVRNMADGVLTLDGDRRVTSVNGAGERLLGLPGGDAVGLTLCELLDCGTEASPARQGRPVRRARPRARRSKGCSAKGKPPSASGAPARVARRGGCSA